MDKLEIPKEWSNKFSLGVNFLDEQHRYFFQILKDLEEISGESSCSEKLKQVFFSMVHYVEHFLIREEMYYKNNNYPGFDAHKKEHGILISEIVKMKDEYANGKEGICDKMKDFMNDWFHKHILGYDRKAVEFLQNLK